MRLHEHAVSEVMAQGPDWPDYDQRVVSEYTKYSWYARLGRGVLVRHFWHDREETMWFLGDLIHKFPKEAQWDDAAEELMLVRL